MPFEGPIVAHGTDLEAVLREAEKATGKLRHELSDCAIKDLLQEVPR